MPRTAFVAFKRTAGTSDDVHSMRLVACQNCHTQFDVTHVAAKTFPCRCGEELENKTQIAVDAAIHRCGSCGAQVGAQAESCDYCSAAIVRDTRKLSLICPECYGRNAESSRFCTACGVGFRPEPVREEGLELPCPCCGCLMPCRQVAGMSVNECPECNGIWAPEDKFDLLVGRAIEARQNATPLQQLRAKPRVKGANPARQRVQYRKCPECEAFMQRRNFQKSSGVIIDRCGDHGTWLDADELEQIAGFILSGGRPGASTQLARDAARDAETRRRAAREAPAPRGAFMTTTRNDAGKAFSILQILTEILE